MPLPRVAFLATTLLATLGAACAPGSGTSASGPAASATDEETGRTAPPCEPLETRPANAPSQRPAFPGQTRACAAPSNVAFDVVVVARGLEHPWAVEPLPEGSLLLTERPGRLRLISAAGAVGAPITGLPEVDAGGQGGLLDVALSPDFQEDRTIFWSYAEPREGGNATSVARGVLSADGRRLEQVRVIFRSLPAYEGSLHFGSRLAFGPDGMLYVTLGERSVSHLRRHAQQLGSHLGKVVRIRPDGAVPEDNPFVEEGGARPEIWTLGHRNVQAAAFDPEGRLWIVEHGTRGGDELNLIERGENYGWPLQAYGIEYSGSPIPGASSAGDGFEQPVYYWDPVIAPSGAQWYTGDAFPEWQGSLFVGALRETRLVRLVIEDDRVTGEEHLLTERGRRIRDVRQGPDGALYIVTDEANGELWRIVPRG
ncbi:MAG TPA: PQQ-dependent sugar dehydrogenase [Rubricoccaceae bacterium]|nr:PQQ-dependent sugar dehydrogenase [Rubricoccaceae bacterium]